MAKITVKAWTDPEFKKSLLTDPKGTLAKEGFDIPLDFDGEITFYEDTKESKNFILPAPPTALSLNQKDLVTLAAQRLSIQLELF